MKLKKIIALLVALALCLTLFAACSNKKEVDMTEGEDNSSSLTNSGTETAPESESESESAPEVIVESETESESASESETQTETESEETETQEVLETDFTEEVYYGARIDGFDINRGKIDLTMCTVKSGIDSNKLTPADFTPTDQTKSLILPGNTKVMRVDGGKVSTSDMEVIRTGIFVVLEGDEDYMELYLYIE